MRTSPAFEEVWNTAASPPVTTPQAGFFHHYFQSKLVLPTRSQTNFFSNFPNFYVSLSTVTMGFSRAARESNLNFKLQATTVVGDLSQGSQSSLSESAQPRA